jgi:hypothetical protein
MQSLEVSLVAMRAFQEMCRTHAQRMPIYTLLTSFPGCGSAVCQLTCACGRSVVCLRKLLCVRASLVGYSKRKSHQSTTQLMCKTPVSLVSYCARHAILSQPLDSSKASLILAVNC